MIAENDKYRRRVITRIDLNEVVRLEVVAETDPLTIVSIFPNLKVVFQAFIFEVKNCAICVCGRRERNITQPWTGKLFLFLFSLQDLVIVMSSTTELLLIQQSWILLTITFLITTAMPYSLLFHLFLLHFTHFNNF